MPRVELTLNTVTIAGLAEPTGQSVVAADDAMGVNDGRTVIRVTNNSGATANLVFETPITHAVGGQSLAIADFTDALPTATTRWYGPLPSGSFNQPSGADAGKMYINTDQTVLMTAVRVP